MSTRRTILYEQTQETCIGATVSSMKLFYVLLCLIWLAVPGNGRRLALNAYLRDDGRQIVESLVARQQDARFHSNPLNENPAASRKFKLRPNYALRTVNDFKDRDSRLGFIRKVYAIFGVQMVTTIAITYTIMNNAGLAGFLLENYVFLSFLSFVGSTAIVAVLVLNEQLRHRPPLNLILLGVHTVLSSLMVGTFSTLMSPRSVCLGTVHTLAAFLAITLYSFQPNPSYDLSVLGNTLLTCLTSLTVGSVLGLFYNMPVIDNLMSGALAVLFAVYLFHDTQKIVGGRHHKYQYGQKEYILAALNLYEDALMLYMKIVELLDKAEKRKRSR